MTQLTDTVAQVAAMHTVIALTDEAMKNGATSIPRWSFFPNGLASAAQMNFDAEPTGAQLDPWLLCLGVCEVVEFPFDGLGAPMMGRTLYATYRGLDLSLTITYPVPAVEVAS